MDVALSIDALVHAADRDELQNYINAVQATGEPWAGLYTPDEIAQMLNSAGFEIDLYLDSMGIKERYLTERSDELSKNGFFHLVSAIGGE